MRITLDDQELSLQADTLGEVLALASQQAAAAGRVIVEVFADGRPLIGDALEAAADARADYGQVHLVSADPREMVKLIFLDAADALDTAKIDQSKAASLIQASKIDQIAEPMNASLSTWQAVHAAIDNGLSLVGIRAEQVGVPVPGGNEVIPLERELTLLASRLNTLKQAMQRQDWSALSDELAFELEAAADRWQEILRSLANLMDRLSTSAPDPGEGRDPA